MLPFDYVDKSFIAVPVTVDGLITKKFIVDTGAGISVISKRLCEQLNCKIAQRFSGKRMSGQSIEVPLAYIKSLAIGELSQSNVVVGVFDMNVLMPGTDIEGMISLNMFKDTPVSFDYKNKVLIFESAASLAERTQKGLEVPVKLDIQGPSLGIFLPLVLPTGEKVSMEVDTGSQALILHERYMKSLKISATSPKVKKREGKDETGHAFVRYFTSVNGAVKLNGNDDFSTTDNEVMFQKIIYDGLVGHYFLRQFLVTYDLSNHRMIFAKY